DNLTESVINDIIGAVFERYNVHQVLIEVIIVNIKLNAIILAICVGSTAGSENGVLWFVIITSMMISIAATVLLALGLQDSIMDSISNGSVPWNVVELVYSFIFAILSVICVWLSFGFANRHLGGTSAGYIAAG
ncbi:hypothetical protein TELCIR_18110, partial [Teladorsagia circumcincta]